MKKVKYISINGKIQIPDEIHHEEFINKLYTFLKNEGSEYHFRGTTKVERNNEDDTSRREDQGA